MNRALEVFYVPLLFLAVTLLGGMHISDRVVFVRPPLSALVLAVLLVAALVRSGAVAPDRLLNPARSPLQNLSGATVLVTTFTATVQTFNSVIPLWGLPRIVAIVFLAVLLLNTLTASTDRTHVLRSVAVIFGSMFAIKFIVLGAVSNPTGGWLKRMLVAALEGATLGMLTQGPLAPATGYLAFLSLMLFLAGLALLPCRNGAHTHGLASSTTDGLRRAE
jgi:hypothetical protein